MAGFEINLYSNKQQFHRYGTDDFALLEIGIGSYNISSLANFLSLDSSTLLPIPNKPLNPDVKEFFSGNDATTIFNKISGKDYESNMKIMEFNFDDKQYKEITGFSEIKKLDTIKFKPDTFTIPTDTNIKDFLLSWDNVQKGIAITDPKIINGYKAVAYKIQNSLSGCITFDSTIKILGGDRTSKIRLYLLDNADSDNSRGIALNGSPFMTDQPSTPYGMRYGFGDYMSSPTAVYPKPSNQGQDDPRNSVAGRMRTVYDPSTGEFESGTQQMLARLLEDIDTADIPDLTVEQLQALSKEEIYDNGPDSAGYMGNFTKGKAIPLSAENGNPYMFGPDFVGGCTGDKKVQITVINRLNQSYKAGSIVVVSRMLGESGNWIIVSPGVDRAGKKKISFQYSEYGKAIIPANYYFTDPYGSILLPDNSNPQRSISSKIRASYYSRFDNPDSVPDPLQTYQVFCNPSVLVWLNTLLPDVADDDNPEIKLLELYNNSDVNSIFQNMSNNRYIDTVNKQRDIMEWIYEHESNITRRNSANALITSSDIAKMPKNVLRRSTKLYTIQSNYTTQELVADGDVGVAEVPYWGMVFSDGYKTSQCVDYKSIPDVKNNIILNGTNGIAGDSNFSELPVEVTFSAPYFGNNIQTLRFLRKDPILFDSTKIKNILNGVKKNGGFYTNIANELNFSNMSQSNKTFNDYVNRIPISYSNIFDDFERIHNPNTTYFFNLEPVNPSKLQFSPCPIELLYAPADTKLDNPSFYRIKNSLNNFNNQWSDKITTNFKQYLQLLIQDTTPSPPKITSATDGVDIGNIYNIPSLSYGSSFANGTSITDRHRAPVGVLLDPQIVPPFNTLSRFPCMPILTCKTTINTNASSLLFTIDQRFGTVAKKTLSGGQGPSVTILPIGGGIGWGVGGTPIQQNIIPQWGDINRTDNIDSFGTTALHVKIFESWPLNQTIFLNTIFTPLHFNPSTDGYKYTLEYNGDNLKFSKNPDPTAIEYSTVDFRLPTKNDGAVAAIGQTVASGDLKPMSDWVRTGIRRAKLLTNGGFVYIKPVFCVSSVKLKTLNGATLGGKGYKKDTIFSYDDGSSFTVNINETTGEIIEINDLTKGYDKDTFLMNNNSPGISSININIVPTQSELEGNGAVFEPSFILCGKLMIDKCPKQVSPIVRLTKSSNMGEDAAEGISTTTINLSDNATNKSYDLFYFFHNDPTHYTLDSNSVYYRDLAQYVISEVKPV